MDILARIKRLVLRGKVLFTRKTEAEIDKLQSMKDEIYVCPNCGKETMYLVAGQCELDDGVVIESLERLHCMICQSDFFDLSVMKKVRKIRKQREVEIFENVQVNLKNV